MKIDWKARLTNKAWWVSTISIVVLIAQYFGFDLIKYIGQDWQTLVALIFALVALMGITVDTSTPGISDNVIQDVQDTINSINTSNKVKIESTTKSINNSISQNSDNK
ncbi:phage holin [Clostridium butyricum]